jgi:hypothetical protein
LDKGAVKSVERAFPAHLNELGTWPS